MATYEVSIPQRKGVPEVAAKILRSLVNEPLVKEWTIGPDDEMTMMAIRETAKVLNPGSLMINFFDEVLDVLEKGGTVTVRF